MITLEELEDSVIKHNGLIMAYAVLWGSAKALLTPDQLEIINEVLSA
jgi:hypothetical protein